MGVPTAITIQNSTGVAAVIPLAPETVAQQLANLLPDMPPVAAKTGMLAQAETVKAVAEQLTRHPIKHLVVDPIHHASSGPALLAGDGYEALKRDLLPLATLMTPNRQEAEQLWGQPVVTAKDAARCATDLLQLGPKAVLVTGGHLENKGYVIDTLADEGGITTWRHPRHPGPSPHGTGCALSAAITAHLALGVPMRESIRRALGYVLNAIRNAAAPGLGKPYLGDGRNTPDAETDPLL